MFAFLVNLARLFRTPDRLGAPSPAATLMEAADSRAGLDAHHARELRAAAAAWLSVVR